MKTIIKSLLMMGLISGFLAVGSMAFAVDYTIEKTAAFLVPKGDCVYHGKTKEGKLLVLEHPICYPKQGKNRECIVSVAKGDNWLSEESDIMTLIRAGEVPENGKKSRDTVVISKGVRVQFDCLSNGKVFANIAKMIITKTKKVAKEIIPSGIRPVAVMRSGENFWRKCSTDSQGIFSCNEKE